MKTYKITNKSGYELYLAVKTVDGITENRHLIPKDGTIQILACQISEDIRNALSLKSISLEDAYPPAVTKDETEALKKEFKTLLVDNQPKTYSKKYQKKIKTSGE